MIEVTQAARFDTSFGTVFVIEYTENIRVGQKISIDGNVYEVKKVLLQTRPDGRELISVFV